MKRKGIILVLLLSTTAIVAQKTPINNYSAIDKKALLIPDSLTKTTNKIANFITANFKNDADKTRAIFIWVATNIRYDVENMFAINLHEKKEEQISKPLLTKKGICINYASLFNDICLKSGIESFIITGYTKQNGYTAYIPHAWCAARVDSTWFLFDPTWGSGYLNDGKFYPKINNDYYKVDPSTLIKSHMPFDYLWQFLNYPISNQEFKEGKTQQNKSKSYFNFIDSIQVYEQLNHIDQLISSAYRVEKNGVSNSLIYDRLQHLKLEIEHDKQNKAVNLYNSAVADYNEGINDFNTFIKYKNNQFTPKKTDIEIQNMIDVADNKIKESQIKLGQIMNPDENILNMKNQLSKSIENISTQVKEQQNWLKLYFSKGKAGRASMFYKMTWMGIPIN